jgi:hypothetical protein
MSSSENPNFDTTDILLKQCATSLFVPYLLSKFKFKEVYCESLMNSMILDIEKKNKTGFIEISSFISNKKFTYDDIIAALNFIANKIILDYDSRDSNYNIDNVRDFLISTSKEHFLSQIIDVDSIIKKIKNYKILVEVEDYELMNRIYSFFIQNCKYIYSEKKMSQNEITEFLYNSVISNLIEENQLESLFIRTLCETLNKNQKDKIFGIASTDEMMDKSSKVYSESDSDVESEVESDLESVSDSSQKFISSQNSNYVQKVFSQILSLPTISSFLSSVKNNHAGGKSTKKHKRKLKKTKKNKKIKKTLKGGQVSQEINTTIGLTYLFLLLLKSLQNLSKNRVLEQLPALSCVNSFLENILSGFFRGVDPNSTDSTIKLKKNKEVYNMSGGANGNFYQTAARYVTDLYDNVIIPNQIARGVNQFQINADRQNNIVQFGAIPQINTVGIFNFILNMITNVNTNNFQNPPPNHVGWNNFLIEYTNDIEINVVNQVVDQLNLVRPNLINNQTRIFIIAHVTQMQPVVGAVVGQNLTMQDYQPSCIRIADLWRNLVCGFYLYLPFPRNNQHVFTQPEMMAYNSIRTNADVFWNYINIVFGAQQIPFQIPDINGLNPRTVGNLRAAINGMYGLNTTRDISQNFRTQLAPHMPLIQNNLVAPAPGAPGAPPGAPAPPAPPAPPGAGVGAANLAALRTAVLNGIILARLPPPANLPPGQWQIASLQQERTHSNDIATNLFTNNNTQYDNNTFTENNRDRVGTRPICATINPAEKRQGYLPGTTIRPSLWNVARYRNASNNTVVCFHGTSSAYVANMGNNTMASVTTIHGGGSLGLGFYVTFNPNEALSYACQAAGANGEPIVFEFLVQRSHLLMRGGSDAALLRTADCHFQQNNIPSGKDQMCIYNSNNPHHSNFNTQTAVNGAQYPGQAWAGGQLSTGRIFLNRIVDGYTYMHLFVQPTAAVRKIAALYQNNNGSVNYNRATNLATGPC